MRNATLLLALLSSVAASSAAACDLERPSGLAPCTRAAVDRLPLGALQVIGTHNSYKLAMPAEELAAHRAEDPAGADGLDYAHASLTTQLDLGLRALELDVYYDPAGGRYQAPPGALRRGYASPPWSAGDLLRMRAPGFKVMHLHDIDFCSNCVTLALCLQRVNEWSQAHRWHAPIMISVNAKDGDGGPGATAALPFDGAAFDALDAEIRAAIPATRLYVPAHLLGNDINLGAAIARHGWPTLGEMRGRILLVLDEDARKRELYRARAATPAMFVASDLVEDDTAILVLNDPLMQRERIAEAIAAGRLVRTRADADTREARTQDGRRREAAFASGAQFISSDYPRPDPRWPGYRVAFPEGGFVRCRPDLSVCTSLLEPAHAQ